MRYVVLAERALNDWAFVGMFDEEDAAEAIRKAALIEEQSDHFKACPLDDMEDKRIAYRRRVVGLQA